ncbi:MAG: hypothetical protein QG657_5341 [Acidobacteriota bacterium]|nr:hypothetical protein [Acidobacteriota bacterium]
MKEKPRLIVVAGPNGSGKTTVTEKLLRHEWMGGCVYINPDVIAQQEFGGWNSQEAFIKMEGGHDVPIHKIINRYYRSIANCVEIMAKIDRVYFYDNSETDVDPSLVFRVSDGKIVKIYREIVPWAKSIADLFPPS